MGDHTDYHEGFVLPLAIGLECTVAVTPTDGHTLRASSAQFPGDVSVAADGRDDPRTLDPAWGRFVAGVARTLSDRGLTVPGADLEISSTVPPGSGLSSSSALSVALTMALTELSGASLNPTDLARLALDSEVAATGVPGGLMDQLASLLGRAGHALLIDCRAVTAVPVPLAPEIAVIVVHSGAPRTLAGSEYGTRRAECETIARQIGVRSLRDATLEQVADHPRARHVLTENARVQATAAALPAGDLSVLGPLLLASHASLRDDYEVSTPELDVLVELLVECGAAGARLTGAGFGGCVVALTQRNHADDVVAKTVLRYRRRTDLEPLAFVARAVDGARRDD